MKKMFIIPILFLLTLPLFVFADDEIIVSWPSGCNTYGAIKAASGRQGWNNATNAFGTWTEENP